MVLSRLDYGNAFLVGLPVHLYSQLESLINAAARLVCNLRFSDHISDAPVSLHWLRSPERLMVKVSVLMFKAIHGSAPTYLSRLVRVADLPGRRSIHSARSIRQLVLLRVCISMC